MKLATDRNNRAQGLVEFALILPILLLMLMLIFDVGRSVYAYSVVHNAAREGARSGIIKPYNVSQAITVANHLTAGLDSSQIVVTTFTTTNTFEVRVSYTFSAATPLLGRLLGSPTNTITLAGRSTMTKEQ